MTGADRLFLAVPLAEDARRAISDALRRVPLPGRPVPPESWHLTLRFLGDTPPDRREALVREVEAARWGAPFRVRFGAAGAFPRPARASVLWLGVDEGADRLADLAREAEGAARRADFAAERRPFRPHLTLARLRTPLDVAGLLSRLPPPPDPMPVDHVVLYRSHLGGGPARYEALRRFPLG